MKTSQPSAGDTAQNPGLATGAPLSDHERLNGVRFTPAQAARVESERQLNGVAIAADSRLVLAAYRMRNGSRFVTRPYCEEVLARKKASRLGGAS